MNRLVPRAGRAFWRREGGQTVVIVAVFMVVLLAVLGLVIDVGELYLTQRHLQTAADSAALAAAQDLPNSSSNACSYSASPAGATTCTVDGTNVLLAPSGANYNSRYGNVQTSAAVECLSVASAGTTCQTGTACNDPAGYSPAGDGDNLGCNAIKVTEQTTVKPFFMQILGFGGQNVTATSTAGIAGGTPHPLDVEMIDDTTASMQTADTCGGTPTDVPPTVPLTQEDCAKAGIRAFLTQLYPCQPALAHCDISDQTSSASLDQVGLVTFPGLASTFTTGTGVAQEMNCTQEFTHNATTPTEISYANNANYQIIPFSSDFRYSDAPTRDPLATLNPDSNLVRSVYWPGDFCPNGGYPVNVSGAPTSSIGGGNTVSANNDAPPPIAAGASTNVDNSGISAGNSVNATNTSAAGITHGNSTNATTSPVAIGGGPNSGSSNDERTQTTNGATGITITRPQNRANNDFLLLTVTGQGANVTSSSNICPTNNPTTWTLVDKKYVSGTVIQETFSAVQTGTGTASYAFNFFSGSCGAAPGNLTLAASAIVVRYTNVGSVDNAVGATGAPTAVNLAGAAPSTVWAAPATTSYASTINTSTTYGRTVAARYVSLSTNCTSTVNGFVSSGGCDNTPVSATGNISGFTFNFTGGAKTNGTTTYTVALYLNTNGTTGSSAATGLNCTIQTNSSGCTITGSIAVTAGQTIQLKVTRSNAGTNVIATASASATEGQAQISNYVELSTPPASCASTTVATCDTASIATPGTLASASLTFANNVPSGSYTVTLFDNGAATASACTISAGSSTCTIAGGLALAAGDNVELRVTGATGTGAFTSTATTALVESVSTLTAPAITTSQPNERIVHLFGTGSTSFATGNDLPVTVSTNSTSEGVDDSQSTAAESVASTTPDNWVAQTVALIPGQPSSITLSTAAGTLPSDYQGNTGDFLLVSVSVEGFNGQVCAPANWNALAPTSSGTGATEITQATFWTTLSTANSDTFTFYPKLAGCTGATLTGAAAAVATTYNGVNVASPVVIASAGNPSGAALTAPANDTGGENEEVVNLFATGDAFSGTTPPTPAFLPQAATSGTSTNVGESAGIQQTAGSQTTQANAFTTNSATWTAQTVDLVPLLNSSITLSTLPSDYQANTGDFLLVSIAVQGFGGTVCKPAGAAGASWNALAPTSSGAGATKLTQATFWTTASTANSDTFTFYPTTSCTGTPVAAAASAVATTYNGVDVASPVTITSGGNASGGNTAAPMMATQNPTGSAFEEVVSLFATGDTFGGATPAFLPEAQTSPSSVWANIGESASPQETAGNQVHQATATSNNSATWTAQTVDLVPLLSSTITVTPPTGYVGGGADLMLVSIAATGLGSGSICAPSSADWAPVPLSTTSPVKHTVTQGDLTQEAFYTSSSEDPTITFTFFSRPSCNGVPMNVGASAVAVTYTGVNTADPFDTPSAAPASGTGATLNPAALTTAAGDELVGLYASDASNLALTGSTILALGNGLSPSSGATNAAPGAGSHSPSTATTSLNPADWTTETIALNPLSNTGIVVQRPGPQAANDFIVVTITANGLATGNICAPDDGTWTELDNPPDRSTSGGVTTTQATYYGPRFGDSPESYLFTFQTNCSAADTALPASATAMAARFTGVNPITPIDIDASGNQIFAPNTGAGTTVNPSPVLPNHIGDWVVGLYGTASTGTFTNGLCPTTFQVSAGAQSETGLCYKSLPPSGFYDPPSATTSAGKPWVTQTIALEAASGACTSCVYGLEDPTTTYNFTDYGLAIQAAETNLDNLAATRPTAQKVIVILSDGDGNITNSGIGHTPTPQPCSFGIQQAEAAEQPQPTNTVPGNTWVFTIAYGALYKSSNHGCTLDTSGTYAGLSAQCAMILMAHNSVTDPQAFPFGNESLAKTTLCPSNTYEPSDPAHRYYNEATGSSLEQVFTEVGVALSTPRLISNDAT